MNLNGLEIGDYVAAAHQNYVQQIAATATHVAHYELKTSGSGTETTYSKGAVVNRIFGGNNLNGTPKGNATVHVFATQAKNQGTIKAKNTIHTDLEAEDATTTYDVVAVYGGGNEASYIPASPYTTTNTSGSKTQVIIEGCDYTSIKTVYGGGNAASVPETNVEIKSAYEIENVFGGGNGKDKKSDGSENPGADVGLYNNGTALATYGTGNVNTLLEGGLIHEAYGGSNQKGEIKGSINQTSDPDASDCDLEITKVVGAGKYADIDGDVNMVLSCQPEKKIDLLFAGADEANVNGNISLTITNGNFGKVFGGNNLGGAVKGKIVVNVEETGCQPIKIDELYLGGNEAAYSIYGYYESNETHPVTGKKILKPRESATDGTPVANPSKDATHTFPYAQPILNVISCTSIGKVFGGGYGVGGRMYADPTVNINMIPGKYANDVPESAENPNKLGSIGNVYGGGNAADVIGNPTVNIGTTTNVEMNTEPQYLGTRGTDYTYNETTKKYEVPVVGAYITGNVFGGGMGKDDTFTCEKAMIGKDGDGVDNPTGGTTVNIFNGTVVGNVYGGGEVGRVEKNTMVTIGLGDGVATGTPTSAPVIKGSVFGGGKGLETHGYSALVRGNPTVTVQGNAKVRGNVYGGGQIASVARYNVAKTDDEGAPYGVKKDEPYALKTNTSGFCSVTIKGYAEIGPETIGEEKTTSVGHVFGAGKGILPGGDYAFVQGTTKRMVAVRDSEGHITGSTEDIFDSEADYITFVKTLALASQTNVTIDGNAKVKGSVFGGSESGFVQFDANVNVLGGTIGVEGKGGADFGNVYGGGKGDVEYTGTNHNYITAGIVKGNTKVAVSQASGKTTRIYHNIYGGGAYGTVGEFEYDTSGMPTGRKTYTIGTDVHSTTGGKAEVYITGGTIGTNGNENGMIFGSSRGDVGAPGSIHDKAAWVYDTHVAIGDTTATTTTTATPLIKGSVYGGGENGHNFHNAYVRINGGTIGIPEGEAIGSYTAGGASYPYRGNVYGGGCGTDKYYSTGTELNDGNGDTYNAKAGIVQGNAIVHITAGTVVHNVYGAGAMGSVGTSDVATSGKTTIDISGGTIGVSGTVGDGNVFGAARGDKEVTTLGLAQVRETSVTVSSGQVMGNVYGGGEVGNVGRFTNQDPVSVGNYNWDTSNAGSGLCTVIINGGKIGPDGVALSKDHGNVYGGGKGVSNTFECEKAMVYKTNVTISNGSTVNGTVYGGGEVGRVEGNTVVTIGTENGTDEPEIKGNVYAAGAGTKTHGYSALVRGTSSVTVQGKAKVLKNVYGGGEEASLGRYKVKTPANENDADVPKTLPYGMPAVLLNGGTSTVVIQDNAVIGTDNDEKTGHVYGAGQGVDPYEVAYTYESDATKPSRMISGNTWEYFADEAAYLQFVETLAVTGETDVTIDESATIKGSVFGGSESGFVYHNTDVKIKNGTIKGDAFGGGRGLATFAEAGRVSGNTNIAISDGAVQGNVYGGGNLGDVGTIKKDFSTYNYTWKNSDCNGNIHAEGNDNTAGNNKITGTNKNTGVCKVTISGGTIGIDNPTDATQHGNVFGAGEGLANTWWCEKATAFSTDVSITKGTVKGNVYGGGQIGRVEDDAKVTIGVPNGTDNLVITGSVFGAGAGLATHGYSALVRGNADVTVQGKAQIGGSVYGGGEIASVGRFTIVGGLPKHPDSGGTCTVTVDGQAEIAGEVFGACKGVDPATIASADRKSMQLAKNAPGDNSLWSYYEDDHTYIWRTYQTEADYLAFLETLALTSNTDVTINGSAKVDQSVYGGGQRGITLGTVKVEMLGGTVNKDVYGGGALANTNKGNWDDDKGTWADGKTSADYTTTVNLLGGTINGDAYGGGLGQLGDNPIEAKVFGDIFVTLGDEAKTKATAFNVSRYTDSHADVVKSGRVFGCNNLNGSPQGDVTVTVYKTVEGNRARTAAADLKNESATHTYEVAAVYGGGNLADYVPTTGKKANVRIMTCDVSIKEVYGGGNAAAVPETDVLVNGAYEIETVFGGGNGKDPYTLDGGTTWKDNSGANIGLSTTGNVTYGSGNTNTLLQGGYIHEAYGGSNEKGTIKGTVKINAGSGGDCTLDCKKIVAAGKNANLEGDAILIMGCVDGAKVEQVIGGADNANVDGNVELTITSGEFGKVFGGNNLGGIIKGHIKVNIEETNCTPIKIDELYLGGNEAAYSVYGYYNEGTDDAPVYKPRTSADDEHTAVANPALDATHTFPYADPELNIISCSYIGKVFGGGLGQGAAMYGNPTVNINMIPGAFASSIKRNGTANEHDLGAIGDVYGGGNAADVYGNTTVNIGTKKTVETVTEHTHLTKTDGKYSVEGAYISGNVFGGGNKAEVTGNTFVNICGTQIPDSESENGYTDTAVDHSETTDFDVSIGKSVYGGGSEADVKGNTFVTMADGYVFNGIFGGGLAGSVGTFTRDKSVTDFGHTANHEDCIGKPAACKDGTGTCYVVVSGGQIGPIEVATEGMARLDADGGPVPQGWVWGAGCGIVEDPATHPDTHFKAYVNNTDVTIKDKAFILESIIGGGEFGRVLGNTLVKIQGGQIGVGYKQTETVNGVLKPKRYTDEQFVDPTSKTITDADALATCSHFPFGKDVNGKKVYDCYDPYADAYKAAHNGSELYSGGVTDGASDGKTWIGCVFAGGSGYMPYVHKDGSGKVTDYDWVRSAGWVEGNTEVRISGGHILSNVYGGNEYTDVKGTSKVIMTGGTIGVPRTQAQIEALPMTGYIYGAGKGDERIHFNTATNVGSAEVEVSGGIVYGSVYGGGEDGHVLGDVKVTIKEGAKIGTCGTSYFDGNVFGGGRGFSGIAQTAGTVGGNVTLNIEGGTMYGSVYGGGRLASVGTQFTAPDDDNYGNFLEDGNGKTYGHVTVNISGGTVGKSFVPDTDGKLPAGAEYSGNVFGGSMGRLDLLNGTRNPIWPRMAQVKNATVNIYDNATIMRNVFGGGELGTVRDDAYVTIGGYKTADADADGNVAVTKSGSPTVRRDVYGGGYGSEDRNYTIFTVNELENDNQYHSHTYAFTPMQFAGCVGQNTYVNVAGGYIRKSVFGGGEMASVGVINFRAEKLNGASTSGKVVVHDKESGEDYFYSNMVKHEDVTKEFALSWPYEFRYVDGYEGATHVKVTGGRLGLIENDEEDGFDDNGDVYGAGKGKAGDYKDYVFCANVGSTDVKIAYPSTPTAYSGTGELIAGAVYGGGEDGHVMGDTKLTLTGGLVYHSIYGAGSGKGQFETRLVKIGKDPNSTADADHYTRKIYSITAGKVFGNSTVEMSGGYVVRNVYGGGNMGSVGKGNYAGGADDYSTAGYGETITGNLWDGVSDNSKAFLNSGICTVNITGGTIGYIAPDPSKSLYPKGTGLPYGNVFGGCRGESAPNISESPRYLYSPEFFVGYANETHVTIEGDNTKILGSVYGGGMDGHVRRDASVTIKGGEIGIPYTDDNRDNVVKTSDLNSVQWLARGNVYGSGSGVGKYKYDFDYDDAYTSTVTYNDKETKEEDYSTSAGSVTRFTKVDIQGGTIHRNVYGGGSLSSIGAPKIPVTRTDLPVVRNDSETGTRGKQTLNEVIISGGQIGDAVSRAADYGGYVFGGSRGDASLNSGTFSTSMFTKVNMAGGKVLGSMFGGGEVGIVKGSVNVDVTGGEVVNDVYGGGALANTNTENPKDSNGKVTSTSTYTTTVNLLGGTINDAFGGGLGQKTGVNGATSDVEAIVFGDVNVNLNGVEPADYVAANHSALVDILDNPDGTKYYRAKDGCVITGNVFGCNNYNGTPEGHSKVHVFKTKPKTGQASDDYDVAYVFGGGNQADYVPAAVDAKQSTEVIVEGCDLTSIREVYGGGYVLIFCGRKAD